MVALLLLSLLLLSLLLLRGRAEDERPELPLDTDVGELVDCVANDDGSTDGDLARLRVEAAEAEVEAPWIRQPLVWLQLRQMSKRQACCSKLVHVQLPAGIDDEDADLGGVAPPPPPPSPPSGRASSAQRGHDIWLPYRPRRHGHTVRWRYSR